MKWKKYTFTTTTEAVDLISAELADCGIEGIEIEDHVPLTESETKGMFIDILPDLGPDDGTAQVSFYLEPDSDLEGTLLKVSQALEELRTFTDIGPCLITESETEDKDWINNWKEFFKPLWVGDILIRPTWEPIPEGTPEDAVVITMDPGMAFGTGGHETTRLCLTQLQKYIGQMREAGMSPEVLDVGTGSGILGIAALKLGAAHVLGTDLDELAIEAVEQNLKDNEIPEGRFHLAWGNIVDDPKIQDAAGYEKYDIAVANILAPVIIALTGEIGQHLKHGGYFITSGIIDTKEADVVRAFEESGDFDIVEINHLGEWVNVTARRR